MKSTSFTTRERSLGKLGEMVNSMAQKPRKLGKLLERLLTPTGLKCFLHIITLSLDLEHLQLTLTQGISGHSALTLEKSGIKPTAVLAGHLEQPKLSMTDTAF